MNGPSPTRIEDFLLKEYDQAWHHLRQNETMRGQYMGFFFTALAAISTVMLTIAKDKPADAPLLLLTLATLGCVLFFIGVFVRGSMTKFGQSTQHHLRMIADIRQRLSTGFDPNDKQLIAGFNTSEMDLHLAHGRTLSVQSTSQLLIEVILCFICGFEAYCTYEAGAVLWSKETIIPDVFLALAIGGATCIFGVSLWWLLRDGEEPSRTNKTQKPKRVATQ